MQLSRSKPPQRLISLVPMIDVLLIMLVFFMVTSTYLDLDMIPVARAADDEVVIELCDVSAHTMLDEDLVEASLNDERGERREEVYECSDARDEKHERERSPCRVVR